MPFPPNPEKQSLNNARQLLQNAHHIVCFSGAGLSAESGISTFRDTETDALWSRFDPMRLASPEGFADDPIRVIDWYNWRRAKLANASPNAGHLALAARPDIIQITQNVDDLLERAGVTPDNIIHLHGTIVEDRCHHACGYHERIKLASPPDLRDCPHCGAQMRPAVVWFGENLPEREWATAQRACEQADCLLVVGTSAAVYPAASLIGYAKSKGASVIVINTQPSGASSLADHELIGQAGALLPLLLTTETS